ncbi:MAG: hypothetical protein R3D55_09035 [Chloroflexota bacterium]
MQKTDFGKAVLKVLALLIVYVNIGKVQKVFENNLRKLLTKIFENFCNYTDLLENVTKQACHSRESGNPYSYSSWIPAFAGTTPI